MRERLKIGAEGRLGLDREPGPEPPRADLLQGAACVLHRLEVHDQVIRARLRELLEEAQRIRHHEVHVQGKRCELAHGADQDGAEGEVGHELPVHHVDVQEIGARARDGPDLILQPREIGGEDGGTDAMEPGFGPAPGRSVHLRVRAHGRSYSTTESRAETSPGLCFGPPSRTSTRKPSSRRPRATS